MVVIIGGEEVDYGGHHFYLLGHVGVLGCKVCGDGIKSVSSGCGKMDKSL